MSGKKCTGHCASFILVIIGALNWGLVGLFRFDLVQYLFGRWPTVPRILYVLVALAGLMILFGSKCRKCCEIK